MCGICGLAIPSSSARTISEATVLRMRDILTHRGPDAAGSFLAEGVGLGHRRLSIVDVAAGGQPMHSRDGRFHIVYNGEVYNHPALMQQLQGAGVEYATRCDTETVLHLYEREGPAALQQLRGMFALAIWDSQRRELFLARDRFGVKPLYYATLDDGTLIFGSEIKSLLQSGLLRAEFARQMLPDLLANYAPSGDETLFAGVRRLPAGHWLRWRDGLVTLERYWDLTVPPAGDTHRGNPAELVREYRERLEEAVRLRLMADVPLGVFLSGGIDSAAITALMSGMVSEPVKSFSVAFAEPEANEFQYARMVSAHCRTDHHEVQAEPADFFEALPHLVWHEDEPIAHPSSIALYFVSRLAAEHVKVVLTGEGSDETLAGYNRYRVTLANLSLGGWYERVTPAGLRDAVRGLVGRLPAHSTTRRRLLRTFVGLPATLESLYFDNFAVFSRAWQQRLFSPGLQTELGATDPYRAMRQAFDRWPSATLLDRLLYADTKTYLHELLMKQDQMSMAASIESRVPFLDHPLVEWSMRLPSTLKLRGYTTKAVLRDAMRELLPAPILARKKMGFPVPVGAWLRGPFRHLLDSYVLHERALARGLFRPEVVREIVARHDAGEPGHDQKLWMLLNLEIWQRIFLDGDLPADHGWEMTATAVAAGAA
jgi:asparagine synthase (glutamine-hydrolysing)